MRLSARVDYALRATVELAASADVLVTAEHLAESQGMPARFLETILLDLRRVGLVRSQRGPEGGYRLARPAAEISLADVIRAIDGPLAHVRGQRPEQLVYPGSAAPLRQVWVAVRASEREILEAVSLADVATGQLPACVQRLAEDPRAWH